MGDDQDNAESLDEDLVVDERGEDQLRAESDVMDAGLVDTDVDVDSLEGDPLLADPLRDA